MSKVPQRICVAWLDERHDQNNRLAGICFEDIEDVELMHHREKYVHFDMVTELEARVQFLVDNWPGALRDGGITFPDGLLWPATQMKEKKHG